MRKYHDLSDIVDENLRQALEKTSNGCFVVVFENPDKAIEAIVMHRFINNISSMIAKENLFSLH